MMRSLCAVAACALVAVNAPHAQEIELPQCDRLLAGYDELPLPERQVRVAQVGACYQRYSDTVINRNYREILALVAEWAANARTKARTEIGAKSETERALLVSEQRIEIAELEQRYEEELRQILAEATPENRSATNVRRSELVARGNAERAALGVRHQRDSAELNSSIRAAYLKVDEELDKRVEPDRMSLARQHQNKLRRSGDLFESFINTPLEQSMKENQAGEPIGVIAEVTGRAVILDSQRQTREAAKGGMVYLGERIRTEGQAKVLIHLDNNTTIQLGEKANLLLDEHTYFPRESDDGGLSWLNGLFKYVSGLVNKEDPGKAADLNLPYGNIGIRG